VQKVSLLGVLLAIGVTLAACMPAPTLPRPASQAASATRTAVIRITADQLAELLAGSKDFVLVNVHIPFEGDLPKTDLAIPYDQIDGYLGQLLGKDAKIVLYCRSGRMSDIAARRLAELGYKRIYDLTGGMLAWEASGRPLAGR